MSAGSSGSVLFRRNRALGYVSNNVPAYIRYIRRRKENVIITCVGRAFHTYSANHFRLMCVSGIHPEDITCLTADHHFVYTASGTIIYAWRSGNVIKHMYKHGHDKPIHLMLPFGDHLISIDESSQAIVWDINTEEKYLEFNLNNDEFKITAIVHPPTYINKILLGSEQGLLQLWNINRLKLIHTFNKLESKILVIESAPAIDVVAIGLLNGTIILLNLKLDERIMVFTHDIGLITGISFRTDGNPIMATSSSNGQIVFWNLEERKVANQINAHDASVTTIYFFQNEPLLLTTSPDNSMKLWIMDLSDGGARLLRIREGHAAPPLCIRYHGLNGLNILSSGEDSSLRVFNTSSEVYNKSLGKASYNRKLSKKNKKKHYSTDVHLMPPISHFTTETTREKEWDNIVAIHSGLVMATTWSFDKSKMGELKLIPEQYFNKNRTDFNVEATCLCLTHCGNFVIIGYSSGDTERFNVQSGLHRATYGSSKQYKVAAIRGVNCDNLNQTVMTGDGEGLLKFWHFNVKSQQKPQSELQLNDGIFMFRAHGESGMLCVILDNFDVVIIDCDIKNIVRKFTGAHTAQITDACFSPDSRWLITASIDCTIKVWDIPSSYLIDQFKLENACISLSMSPTGDFLATAHVNFLGIYLWANKTIFSHVALRSIPLDTEAPLVDLPTSVAPTTELVENTLINNIDELTLMERDDNCSGELINTEYKSSTQIDNELITMSTLSLSRWQNLLNLDIIKKHNKPRNPIKVPERAPFFLPTLIGPEIKFDIASDTTVKPPSKDDLNSQLLNSADFNNFTIFGKLLNETISTKNFQPCIDHLIALGPSMINFEIKSLNPDANGSIEIMLQFMKMIEFMFASNLHFELAQSYLALFLKLQDRAIVENLILKNYLDNLEMAQDKGWKSLEKQLFYGLGVVSALRNF